MKLTKNIIIRNWQLQAVTGMVLVQAMINYIWLKMDNFPLWFDYGGYFKRSIDIFYASNNGIGDLLKAILGIGAHVDAYQPQRLILPLFTLPWYYLFGVSADVAVMSGSIFLVISLFSIYDISSRMFNKTVGLLAVFILSVSPGFFTLYRRYSPEFACTAMIALAACLLLRSENFQNKKYSILAGVAFGSSMITKELAFVFLLGIFVYSVYIAIKEKPARLANIISFLLSMMIIVFPWFWLHQHRVFSNIVDVAFSNRIREMFGMVSRFSFPGVAFYIKKMINFSFLNPNFFLFILGTVLLIMNKAKNRGLLFVWLVSAYLLLISAQTRAVDYGLPLLIPVSIISAYGMINLFKNKLIKFVLVILVLICGIFRVFVYSFPVFSASNLYILNPDGYGNYFYPIKDNWKLQEIIGYLKENIDDGDKIVRIHVGANTAAFSGVTLAYAAEQKKIKSKFAGGIVKFEEILSFDFVIVKSGQVQGMFYSFLDAKQLKEDLDKNGFIQLSKTFVLPDNSQVTIYKNGGKKK